MSIPVLDKSREPEREPVVMQNNEPRITSREPSPGPHRIRVKICGITNREDAEAAIELGADALGFNLYPGSKRIIDLRAEADWIRALPPFVTKVAVMVNPSIAEAEAVFQCACIDVVQFHGAEDEMFCGHFARLGLPFIKAIALKDPASIERIARFNTPDILVDAYCPHAFGGTGTPVDLDLAETFAASHRWVRVILSGGLTPENVGEAIRRVRPYAVNVASGVESAPRKKDRTRIAEFIRATRLE